MITRRRHLVLFAMVALTGLVLTGCAQYKPLIKPTPKLSVLSPTLTDENMEKMLKVDVKAHFPAVLAVAKVENAYPEYVYEGANEDDKFAVVSISAQERQGWENLKKLDSQTHHQIVRRIQFINPSLLRGNPSLKKLRQAATMLHAPLLLVYIQQDDGVSNFNFLPGYSVGYVSVCQAALIDVQTGIVLGTAESESKSEQKVTIFGVESTKTKLQQQMRSNAVNSLQKQMARGLTELER